MEVNRIFALSHISRKGLMPMGLWDMLPRMTPEEAVALVRAETARRGWSRGELAEQAGVNASNLSQILNGETDPRLSTWIRITTALGLTLSSSARRHTGQDRALSDPERHMQPSEPSTTTGGAHGGAISPEEIGQHIATAVARAVASKFDEVGERLERVVERVAARQPPRHKAPARVAGSRKTGR